MKKKKIVYLNYHFKRYFFPNRFFFSHEHYFVSASFSVFIYQDKQLILRKLLL